jgi:hypothetical protein
VRLVYLDEAGISNEEQEPYLVVAGVIVDADKKWRALEEYFRALSEEYFRGHTGHPIVFHAMDIWHGRKLFDRNKWPTKKRLALLRRLAKVPREFDLPIVMGHVHRVTAKRHMYRGNLSKVPPRLVRANLHGGAFFTAVRRVESWMAKNTKNEVAMLIAEDTPEIKDTIHALHKAYTDQTIDTVGAFHSRLIVDAVHFAKKEHSLLLQIADICAFFMKRKLMKKEDSEKLFAELAPQIWWHQHEGEGIAITIKLSDLAPVGYENPGTLPIGEGPEIEKAFNSLLAGLRSGRGIDNLRPHIQILQAAQDQSFRTPAGQAYLAARPTLRQRINRLHRRSGQR